MLFNFTLVHTSGKVREFARGMDEIRFWFMLMTLICLCYMYSTKKNKAEILLLASKIVIRK